MLETHQSYKCPDTTDRLLLLTTVLASTSADVKATKTTGPVLIHVITDKGRGYDPALSASDRMHGVGKFDALTGKQFKGTAKVRPPPSNLQESELILPWNGSL